MNWLLSVADNLTSGNKNPDWTVGPQIDLKSLCIGILIGIGISLCIWGLSTLLKLLIKYSENIKNQNTKKR